MIWHPYDFILSVFPSLNQWKNGLCLYESGLVHLERNDAEVHPLPYQCQDVMAEWLFF